METGIWLKISLPQIAGCLPTADRQSLANFTAIADIQAWTRAKADEYRKFAVALLSIHNIVTPINRLPIEVLEKILGPRYDLQLLHVCTLWRSILSDRFWAGTVVRSELHQEIELPPVSNELPFTVTFLPGSPLHARAPGYLCCPSLVFESLVPHFGHLSSLHVAVDEDNLRGQLWPALRLGMSNLATLTIEVKVTEEEENKGWIPWYRGYDPWNGLRVLSVGQLPLLARLTCPHTLLGYIVIPSLKHLKLQWWHSSRKVFYPPGAEMTILQGELKRYGDLKSLEIGQSFLELEKKQTLRLSFPSLSFLRINQWPVYIHGLLDCLSFPPTTHVNIIDSLRDGYTLRDEDALDSLRNGHTLQDALPKWKLAAIVGAVDCLRISQPWSPPREITRNPVCTVQCYASDFERLRADSFCITPKSLVAVFRDHARITQLALSSGTYILPIDFRAFPHLEHFSVDGKTVEDALRSLQPSDVTEPQAGPEPVCPSLAHLRVVFSSEPDISRQPGGATDSVDLDTQFRQKCSVLQEVLALRASRGSRLASLEVCVQCGNSEAERLSPMDPGSAGDGGAENMATEDNLSRVFPSQTSVLDSLREVVSGPVTLKFDGRGGELSLDVQ